MESMIRLLPILSLLCLPGAFAAGAPEKVFPFPYTQEDLPNGLRLITVSTGFPNIVALQIVVRAGSRHEIQLDPENGGRGFQRLHQRRLHGISRDVFEGRSRYHAHGGSRPLPEP